ncbi:nitrous oxide reductase accessory protein NosL [Azospirillum agricola]|uniref:nitrous oxide reductase accessory protein NosL n=1 Tax=Azospirillum agricola TaxID=1720247 RepID=UPI000A0F017D|nr:nitrous oxide reductase accessory protein NosL [Azospirillum agricola]SMH36691.1 copper chaperone NosL [Azospirillum lipoferum]
MRTILKTTLLAAALLMPLSACKQEKAEAPPPPQAIAADAVGRYCGMNLADHAGPKGQVILKGTDKPVWLSSVRDTLAFTALPEEPKDYRAVYVTDVGRTGDPDRPDLSAWVEARQAWYVLNSGRTGGMGEAETLPFGEEAAARRFAAANGGTVKRFAELTEEEILMPGQPPEPEAVPPPEHGAHGAHGGHGAKGAM